MKDCGCGFFFFCDRHNKQMADLDDELRGFTSNQLAQSVVNLNSRIERKVAYVEDKAAKWETVWDAILCVVGVGIIIVAVFG